MDIEKLRKLQTEYLSLQERKRKIAEIEKNLKESIQLLMGEEMKVDLGNNFYFLRIIRKKKEYNLEFLKTKLGKLYPQVLSPDPLKIKDTIKMLQWTKKEKEELDKSMKVIKQFESLSLRQVN